MYTNGQAQNDTNKDKAWNAVLVLDNVLLPLLQISDGQGSNLRSSLHLTYAKKFASAVCKFSEQENKRFQLDLPKGLQADVDIILSNKESVNLIEKQALKWNSMIHDFVELEISENTTHTKSPMDEIEFWRSRHINLSAIVEQIKREGAKIMMEVLQRCKSPILDKLEERIRFVTKLEIEASDNAKFLGTLERHIRTLQDGALNAATESIPSLVDGMKMVWIVSRHYNREDRMLPLMQKVAYQIELRVRKGIDLGMMIESMDNIRKNLFHSKTLLEAWKTSYFKTRLSLENISGGHRRWEFDQTLLFENSEYMRSVVDDLIMMIDSISDFNPDLFHMMGNDDAINTVIKQTEELSYGLSSLKFDIFLPQLAHEWESVVKRFKASVCMLERNADIAIKTIFRQLLSSEKAFDLAKKIQSIKARASIHRTVTERFVDILVQFERELDQLNIFFTANKKNPPSCMRFYNAAGKATWANQLYLRAKRRTLFLLQNGMLSSKQGIQVKDKYLQLSHDLDIFKNEIFKEWSSKVLKICKEGVSRSIIRFNHSKNLEVNFDDDFKSAFIEIRQFQSLGFTIPTNLYDFVLLQETLESYILDAEVAVKLYNSLLASFSSLRPHERYYIEANMNELELDLSKGLQSLTWNSQRITSFLTLLKTRISDISYFIERARISMQDFDSLLNNFRTISVVKLPSQSIAASSEILTEESYTSNNSMTEPYFQIKCSIRRMKEIMRCGDSINESGEKFISWVKHYQQIVFQAQCEIAIRSLLRWAYIFFSNQTKIVRTSEPVQLTEMRFQRGIDEIFSAFKNMEPWKDFCDEKEVKDQDETSYFDAIINDPSVSLVLEALSHTVDRCSVTSDK